MPQHKIQCAERKKETIWMLCVTSAQVCEHMENTISLFGSFAPSAPSLNFFLPMFITSPCSVYYSRYVCVFLRQEYTIVESYQLAIWYMLGKCLPLVSAIERELSKRVSLCIMRVLPSASNTNKRQCKDSWVLHPPDYSLQLFEVLK